MNEFCMRIEGDCPLAVTHEGDLLCNSTDSKITRYKNTKGFLKVKNISDKVKCKEEVKNERQNA